MERIRLIGGVVPDVPLSPSFKLGPWSSAEFELLATPTEAVLPALSEKHKEGDEDYDSDYARNDTSDDWTRMHVGMGEGRAWCWGRGAVGT
jgi:hypothetical protein